MSPPAGLAAAPASRPPSREFPAVLAGVALDGPTARLAGMLDPAFLAEADRVVRGAFAAVPPHCGDDDGAVPGRPARPAAGGVGPVPCGGVFPAGRKRARVLSHPLRAVARRRHRGSGDRPAALGADRAGGVRRRAGQPARACPAGGRAGAVRDLAAHPRRGQDHRREPARGLRHAAAAAVGIDRGLPPAAVRAGRPARALLAALARHVRHSLADPAAEQDSDVWDLAIFGHHGRLSFTGISQPWLARAAKAWAASELPRHRGRGASRVRAKVNALARLSESLRARGDHGMAPASLSRPDIGLGAQAGEAQLRQVFTQAGFGRFRRAAETPLNLILEARP